MNTLMTTVGSLVLLVAIGLFPRSADAQYVDNRSYCLSVDTSDTVGDMAYLVNSCSEALKVTYCFGAYSCQNTNGTGATDVGPRDRRTIFYDHREYSSWSLVAFACSANVDFQDCQQATQRFFRDRNRNGPRR